jgi:hypothetical protein
MPQFDQTKDIDVVGLFLGDLVQPENIDAVLKFTLPLDKINHIFMMKSNNSFYDVQSITSRYNSEPSILPEAYNDFEESSVPKARVQFLQFLSSAVFGSSAAIDLFSNETSIINSYESAVEDASVIVNNYPTSSVKYLYDEAVAIYGADGETLSTEELISGRASIHIILSLLKRSPERFAELVANDTFIPIPLHPNDKLQMVFTINSNEGQVDIFGNTTKATQRVLVEINISEGEIEPGFVDY